MAQNIPQVNRLIHRRLRRGKSGAYRIVAGFLFASGAAIMPAGAEVPIGKAINIVEDVNAKAGTEKRAMSMNAQINAQEVIETGQASFAGIVFNDTSTLSIGENASVLMDEFVYDPNASTGSMVVTMAVGAARFVSGQMPSSAIKLRAPTATIGIRGTVIEVAIAANGATTVNVVEGVAVITNAAGVSVTVPAGMSTTLSPPVPGSPPPAPTAPAPPPAGFQGVMQTVPNIAQPTAITTSTGSIGTITSAQGVVTATNVSSAIAAAGGIGSGVGAGTAAGAAGSGIAGTGLGLGTIGLGVAAAGAAAAGISAAAGDDGNNDNAVAVSTTTATSTTATATGQ